MKTKIKPTSVRLDKEILDQLEEITKTTRRSKSWIINEAIQFYLYEKADLDIALDKLQNPNTEYIDWEKAKNELLNQD